MNFIETDIFETSQSVKKGNHPNRFLSMSSLIIKNQSVVGRIESFDIRLFKALAKIHDFRLGSFAWKDNVLFFNNSNQFLVTFSQSFNIIDDR